MKYTQEQLEGMINFELNCLVAEYDKGEKLPKEWRESHFFRRLGDCLLSSDGDFSVKTLVKDYCNSWADMGPLIQELSIDIEWPESLGQASKYMQGTEDIFVGFKRKEEALRAAAIVYILVKQEGLA